MQNYAQAQTVLSGVVNHVSIPTESQCGPDQYDVNPGTVAFDVHPEQLELFRKWFMLLEGLVVEDNRGAFATYHDLSDRYAVGDRFEITFDQYFESLLTNLAYKAQCRINAIAREARRDLDDSVKSMEWLLKWLME